MIKIVNAVFPFSDFLYLLQLEEYDTRRYFKLFPRFLGKRNFQKRQKLVVTSRIKTTFTVALSFVVFVLILFSLIAGPVLAFIIAVELIPFWVLLANIILNPIYDSIKTSLQKKAAKYFAENFKGKVIAIAGSYGKTTTKNYLYELVRFNYKTQMIPGNINTPTGIANWVLTKLDNNTEILLVEMDTYFVGEIARSCAITPPDIAVLTNIGDQHLERLGTRANLKKALLEVFKYAKPSAIKIKNKSTNLEYALEVAKILDIPKDIVSDTVDKLEVPDRRHKKIEMHGFTTIDDSYNISFATAEFGLNDALHEAKKAKKKLIVITGGIPELGEENRNANIDYGKLLRQSGAEVILLKTILHNQMLEGLGKDNVKFADSMNNAWEIIRKDFSMKKHLVLMQPELGDNYY